MWWLAAGCAVVAGCGRIDLDPLPDSGCPGAIVQAGDLVIAATATSASVPLAVPIDRSVLFSSVREIEPSPTYGATLCELVPEGLSCVRTTAGTDYAQSTGEIMIHWSVVTFVAASVIRGRADLAAADPFTATLAPPVDPASTFTLLGGGTNNDGLAWGTDEFGHMLLADPQTLDVDALGNGETYAWQVVTLPGATVQRGALAFGATDLSLQFPLAGDPTSTIVLVTNTADSTATSFVSTMMLEAELTDPAHVTVQRAQTFAAEDASWEATTLPFAVQHGVATFAPGVTTVTAPLPGFSADTTVALATVQALVGQTSGSTDYAGAEEDLVGEGMATLTPTASGLVLERASATSNTTIGWQAIDFGRPRCAP